MLQVNRAATAAGQELPYPQILDLPPTDERFGFAYAENELLPVGTQLNWSDRVELWKQRSSMKPGAPESWKPALPPAGLVFPAGCLVAPPVAPQVHVDLVQMAQNLISTGQLGALELLRTSNPEFAKAADVASTVSIIQHLPAAPPPPPSITQPLPQPTLCLPTTSINPSLPWSPALRSWARGDAATLPPMEQYHAAFAPPSAAAVPTIAASETPRLQRATQPPAGSKPKVRGSTRGRPGPTVSYMQRKGYFATDHSGAGRATFLSASTPIMTLPEVSLFNQLLLKHTRGKSANFHAMARDFNVVVAKELRQEQQLGCQGNQLMPKTPRELAAFDRKMAKELARRDSASMRECLSHIPPSAAMPFSVGAQEVLNVFQQLMANSRATKQPGTSAAVGADRVGPEGSEAGGTSNVALAAPAPSGQPPQSRATSSKPRGQGQGGGAEDACGACKAKASEWGEGVSLNEHRRQCIDFQRKYPLHRALKKPRTE